MWEGEVVCGWVTGNKELKNVGLNLHYSHNLCSEDATKIILICSATISYKHTSIQL